MQALASCFRPLGYEPNELSPDSFRSLGRSRESRSVAPRDGYGSARRDEEARRRRCRSASQRRADEVFAGKGPRGGRDDREECGLGCSTPRQEGARYLSAADRSSRRATERSPLTPTLSRRERELQGWARVFGLWVMSPTSLARTPSGHPADPARAAPSRRATATEVLGETDAGADPSQRVGCSGRRRVDEPPVAPRDGFKGCRGKDPRAQRVAKPRGGRDDWEECGLGCSTPRQGRARYPSATERSSRRRRRRPLTPSLSRREREKAGTGVSGRGWVAGRGCREGRGGRCLRGERGGALRGRLFRRGTRRGWRR